ncbi:hypothetical protein SAMN05443667_11244 [Flavobacterium gillisiae]|uniref:Glycoside hydrolase 123-like N-terminal domain-containing protein n=1 Tax=Flavobacterium gillisiae TaxID=150146 RepID=A0A1H4F667_9FLAO|nr:glycoside hydrolase domain-containing protein [Flavobacterium gillisiae]SEA92855.1 hypothetical protein SAMN05443667_11244 [Flavobacterium gillisiae]
MKKIILILPFFLLLHSVFGQQINYTSGNNGWDPDVLGNHRFIINVSTQALVKNKNVSHVIIPWRRKDTNPEAKALVVIDAKTNKKITNVTLQNSNRELGELLFEPVSGAGNYYVYYLLYRNEGSANYPKGVYLKSVETASADWLKQVSSSKTYAEAQMTEYQSVDDFNSFYPMDFIATVKEKATFLSNEASSGFVVIPEDRMFSIRMKHDLPMKWMNKPIPSSFTGEANKGEYYAYQLGVYALQNLKNVKVIFSKLTAVSGETIPVSRIACINTDGTTYDDKPFKKIVDVIKDDVQPLWCGIDVPQDVKAGDYIGQATVTADGQKSRTIQINLKITDKLAADGGISEPWKQTRLKWLNSSLAQENTVIAPYIPLEVDKNTISLLGRKMELNEDGFPKQIQTFFTPEMTSIGTKANDLLIEPAHFKFLDSSGKECQKWKISGVKFLKKDAGTVAWESSSTSDAVQMDVNAALEFDGFLSYTVKITALEDVVFSDINFHLPMQPTAAKYLMGLGQKGGNRPENLQWKWDVANKNQDGAWIGNVNAGLQFSLRDEKYSRPLNTNFYLQKPLLLPTSWGNDNKGGINVSQKGKAVLVNAYSGSRGMKKGEVLYYNFTLLITPFHAIDTDFQWETRFYHSYNAIDSIKATGATVANIHHATPINPYINYPFIEHVKMKTFIDEAHSKGLKVKIYNTVRELSNKAYETFAMRSLGHEIYSPGKGGGFSWLQEHIGDDYLAAWFVPEIKDAAIVNSGMSRWHNYYVEGMNWLTKEVGIDGIYLDDVAFDRITMKRIKRVLTQNGHPGIIDLHSANQYNKSDGFNNSANLYMEHFPYLNRLWFGEYFDYEKSNPDFFLTEVSGIPYGLMGEMLQDGGNPWRGMIYGMTNRMPWSDNADPRPIWKVWDDFGMKGTEMIGYWSENCPVKTSNDKVLATVYKKNGTALIAIASWADTDVKVKLNIDWKKLGIDPAKATITAPAITNFQPSQTFFVTDEVAVTKGKGWLLIVKE